MSAHTTHASEGGALNEARLRTVLAEVCAQAGLDPVGAELMKFTNNAAFRLASAPVVVRIAGSRAVRDKIDLIVQVARWFADAGVPAVRLVNGIDQPVRVGAHAATLWEYVPPEGPQPSGSDLGRILRSIHALPAPAFELPIWNPVPKFRTRIDDAEGLSRSEREWLEVQCDEIADELAEVDFQLKKGVIHGDPFLGNVIPGRQGPVICDFDGVSYGPREWDLTPIAVGKLRMDYSVDAHAPLVQSYGYDVMNWKGFSTLRRLRELQLVTSVLPVLKSNPRIRQQWEHRFKTLRAGDESARWSTYK